MDYRLTVFIQGGDHMRVQRFLSVQQSIETLHKVG